MLRHDHDSTPVKPRRRRPSPGTFRGGLACAGSLLGLVSIGAAVALAGPGGGGPLAGRTDAGLPTIAPTTRIHAPAATAATTRIHAPAATAATTRIHAAAATGATGATGPTNQGTFTSAPSSSPAPSALSAPSASSAPPAQASPAIGPLIVTMTASSQVVRVDQTVTYTADVSGAPPGKRIIYQWGLDGGGTATGRQISRSYPTPGQYSVAVNVTVASVTGLSGLADQVTVVVPNARPSKLRGSGTAAGGGSGSGHGKGGGGGSGSAKSPAARAKRSARATTAQGVANPLPAQAPSGLAAGQVEGFLLTVVGVPFVPPATSPTPAASSSGGSDSGFAGGGSAAAVGGGIALTIAIVTLGALDERRRISLRNA